MSDTTKVIAPPEQEAEAATASSAGEESLPAATVAEPASSPEVAEAVSAAALESPAIETPAEPAEPAAAAAPAEPAVNAAPAGPAASSAPTEAAPAEPDAGAAPDADLEALRKARDERRPVEGRVFGWNPGGFHVVIGGLAAFVPRSEMELEPIADPESYLDKTFSFQVLKIQGKGKRIVLSRTSLLRQEHDKQAQATVSQLRAGAVVKGKVASLTDFGAFVDIGGVEGLVHVSEISRSRVNKPSDALQVGQEVEVKILKVEKGGRRVSLSIKALEPDPWREIREKYPEGAIVTGKVERTDKPGAFIELEPGLVGLLPTSEMGLPREAIPARAYPKGKEVRVQVVGVDPKRRRISLAPEGSQIEGTRGDYQAYLKQQRREVEQSAGLGALAAAFSKIKGDQ